MQPTLRLDRKEDGKLERRSVEAAYGSGFISRRLHILDRNSQLQFLIDTGSDVSILPVPKSLRKSHLKNETLSAANSTSINCYGFKTITIDLGLRPNYKWTFNIADIDRPMIGADFLFAYGIDVNLRARRITDTMTNISVPGLLKQVNIHSIKVCTDDSPYHLLLSKFPSLTKPPQPNAPIKHNVVHHIETQGPPPKCKPRRLAPDKLKIAKKEFEELLSLGHIRRSRSELHMVPKKNAHEWRPCGDYPPLNAITKKDKYGVPNICDFTHQSHGKKIFSHIDLNKAFNQIPVAEEDIHKTAVTTPFGLFYT